MHIISKKKLRDFWMMHRDSEAPLRSWFQVVRTERWRNFLEVRARFPKADRVANWYVFNIAGNKYRLIAAIHFNRQKIFIRHVLTHADYDRGGWKRGVTICRA